VSEARWSRAAGVLGVLILALWATALGLEGPIHQLSAASVVFGTGVLVFAGVGILVARRQPRNPVGWLLILFTFLFLLGIDGQDYAVFCYLFGHQRLPLASAAVVFKQVATVGFLLLPAVILLFPDGRLASPRWRWALGIYAVVSAVVTIDAFAPPVAAVAARDVHVDSSGDITDASHLRGWLVHPPVGLVAAVWVLLAGIWLSFVAYQFISWRRSDGERRQQLKWLACGAAVALGIGVGASSAVTGVLGTIFSATLFALPVSIGVGILRYRLYDIDRIISRTLAYTIITGLLIGVYTGLVLLATDVLDVHSSVAVAASTLAAAALFNPVRRRVQRAVARRFNRARYDADRTVAAFAARLKDAVDLDSVRNDLAGVVLQTLEPAHLSVWVRPADVLVSSAGEDLASAEREPVAAFLAVIGEPGPEQGRPRGQDAPLDQGQGRAVLAG
jgi:hypothetical protein